MAGNIELVIFGSEEQADKSAKGIPIRYRSFNTYEAFKDYFANLPGNIFIILLFLNPSNAIRNSVLQEIKSKRQQIIRVLISGDKPIDTLMNITYVSELLLTYKLNASFERFLDRECTKQRNLGNIEFSRSLDEQRTKILEHGDEHDEVSDDYLSDMTMIEIMKLFVYF